MIIIESLRRLNQSGMLTLPETKVCNRCKKPKPRKEFKKTGCTKDGLDTTCRKCVNDRARELKKQRAEEKKIYKEKYFDF